MNHKISFLLTLCTFSITFACKAMEDIHQYKELKFIEKPFFAQYITHDRAVIAGEKECCIINPITDEVVKKIETEPFDPDYRNFNCALHPNKKKFALGYRNTNTGKKFYTVAIYNTTTGKQEWCITQDHPFQSFTFNPINNTILINDYINHNPGPRQIIEYDYITHQQYKIDSDNG